MAKRSRRKPSHIRDEQPIAWLPIDSRLFTPFLSFGHVKGIAKIFLITEMTLSFLVVLGSLLLFVLSVKF